MWKAFKELKALVGSAEICPNDLCKLKAAHRCSSIRARQTTDVRENAETVAAGIRVPVHRRLFGTDAARESGGYALRVG